MNNIPVVGAVSRAYGFLLGEIGTIVRLTWAPLLLGAGVSYFYGGAVIDAAIDAHANSNPSASSAYAPVQFLIGLTGFVTSIIAEVALLRVVVFGDRKPGLYVYLWLGGGELRLIAVTILLGIATAAAAIAAGLVFGILAALSAAIPVFAVLLILGFVACVCVAVWAALRLSLVAPIVVTENTLGVERSWAVTRGQALHMLGVILLTYGPLFVLSMAVFFVVLGSDIPPLPMFSDVAGQDGKDTGLSKEAVEAFAKAIERWEFGFIKAMRAHWTAISVLSFLGNIVSTALWAGALGSAYTARVGEPAH